MYRRRIEALKEVDEGAADVGEAEEEQRLLQALQEIKQSEKEDDDEGDFPEMHAFYKEMPGGLSEADADAIHSGSSKNARGNVNDDVHLTDPKAKLQ